MTNQKSTIGNRTILKFEHFVHGFRYSKILKRLSGSHIKREKCGNRSFIFISKEVTEKS